MAGRPPRLIWQQYALAGPCKEMNVDVVLGPLDRAYSEFLRAVEVASSGISVGESALLLDSNGTR
eukprot:5770412-Prymnesium_polylepis.1